MTIRSSVQNLEDAKKLTDDHAHNASALMEMPKHPDIVSVMLGIRVPTEKLIHE